MAGPRVRLMFQPPDDAWTEAVAAWVASVLAVSLFVGLLAHHDDFRPASYFRAAEMARMKPGARPAVSPAQESVDAGAPVTGSIITAISASAGNYVYVTNATNEIGLYCRVLHGRWDNLDGSAR